jgi:hypothetical protein
VEVNGYAEIFTQSGKKRQEFRLKEEPIRSVPLSVRGR